MIFYFFSDEGFTISCTLYRCNSWYSRTTDKQEILPRISIKIVFSGFVKSTFVLVFVTEIISPIIRCDISFEILLLWRALNWIAYVIGDFLSVSFSTAFFANSVSTIVFDACMKSFSKVLQVTSTGNKRCKKRHFCSDFFFKSDKIA